MILWKKIVFAFILCGLCSLSFAKSHDCDLNLENRKSTKTAAERLRDKHGGGNWDKAVEYFAKTTATSKYNRCILDHLYCYGCQDMDWNDSQPKILQSIADEMYPSDKAILLESLKQIMVFVAEEKEIFAKSTQELQNRERLRTRIVINQTLESLGKKYKLKGKDGKEILVRGEKTNAGYVILIDKKTAWENFDLADQHQKLKNEKWVSYYFHPVRKNFLVPTATYDDDIFNEKLNAFYKMCQYLGVKSLYSEYYIFNSTNIAWKAELIAKASIFAKLKANYLQEKNKQQKLKTLMLRGYEGNHMIRDPRKDEYLKAWIDNDANWKSLCESRLNENRLINQTATFSYESNDDFSFAAGMELKVFWWVAAKGTLTHNHTEKQIISWDMKVIFPERSPKQIWWDTYKYWILAVVLIIISISITIIWFRKKA